MKINNLESIVKIRDAETQQANQHMTEMRIHFNNEMSRVETGISNVEMKVNNKVTIFEQKLLLNDTSITNFETIMKEMQLSVQKTYDVGTKHSRNIDKLTSTKLESKEFFDTKKDLLEQIESIRFASYDNFRVLRATDNYIEKYLPF